MAAPAGPPGQGTRQRPVEIACGVIGAGLLALVVAAGYVGSESALNNFAPTFVLITFWVGVAFASALLGDIFRAFNPWRAVGRASGWLAPCAWRARARAPPLSRPPRRWPAAVGLLAFTWIELVSEWGQDPRMLATAICGYSVRHLARDGGLRRGDLADRGETFSVYYNLLSRISPFETTRPGVGSSRAAWRPAAARRPARHRCVRPRDDRHRHLRRVSQGQVWRDLDTACDELISAGMTLSDARKITGRSDCWDASRWSAPSTHWGSPARGPWAVSSRPRSCVLRSFTHSSRSRWSTWWRTT